MHESPRDEVSLPDLEDNGTNWAWHQDDRDYWQDVTDEHDEYRRFYQNWRDATTMPGEFENTPPYKLSLGECLPPLLPRDTSGNQILVTESYEGLYRRILRLRKLDAGYRRGVVLTGQPGIGKSTFLKFMLVRLLSARQVVALCYNDKVLLFYGDKVYQQPTSSYFKGFPTHQRISYCPVWMLVDIDFQDTGLPLTDISNVWPIQASSPTPIRWRTWSKRFQASLLIMPLWTMEELTEGLCLLPGYDKLQSQLRQSLPSLDGLASPITTNRNIRALLAVLQKARERVEIGDEEDCIRISTSTAGQDVNMEPDQRLVPADQVGNAFKILVRNATEEFGFIPRDVYNSILDLPSSRKWRDRAVRKLDYSKLGVLVGRVTGPGELDQFSRLVVAVDRSSEVLPSYDSRGVDFKSIRIAREAVESMRLEEDEQLRGAYNSINWYSEGYTLAGWVFQAVTHRMLSGGSTQKLTTMHMVSNGDNPPAFSTPKETPSLSSSTSDPPSLFPGPSHTRIRTVTRIDFTHELGYVTLDRDRYYIPTTAAHSLFDSFAIDPSQHTIAISVFQIAVSSRPGGSAEGYPFISEIVAHVQRLLKNAGSDAKVGVACFLVYPGDGTRYEWQAPVDWDKIVGTYNHDWRAFCIRLPGAFRPSADKLRRG